MATEEKKKPVKGILKSSSSFDHEKHKEQKDKHDKEMKWDEMNILATHHPPDKDYGHMKIDEPPTPYSKSSDVEDDDEDEDEDKSAGGSGMGDILPEDIANRLAETQRPRATSFSEGDESSEDENETEEDRAKKSQFEQKRKLHYNEFQAVKLAKQLMEEEEEEDEEDENNEVTTKSEVIQPMEENSASNSLQESS